MRIGEFSRRVGVPAAVLRAWEQRYGLLSPRRTAGNARLYSALDVARVRLMQRYLARSVSASEAAELVLAHRTVIAPGGGDTISPHDLSRARDTIRSSLEVLDETGAHDAFNALLGTYSSSSVLRDLVVPYMREVGERWEQARLGIAQEHFASNFFLARLLALSRGWDHGLGPRALLATVPGEHHTLGLITFGIALHQMGWRITYLGADVPAGTVAGAAAHIDADLVVLSGTLRTTLPPAHVLRDTIGGRWPLLVGGPGVDRAYAEEAEATRLADADPVGAARVVATGEILRG